MIHGGLMLDFKSQQTTAQHCCLRKTFFAVDAGGDVWRDQRFNFLREKNKSNQWDPGCSNCEFLEKSKLLSFRQGMNQGLGIHGQTDLTGPSRIDLMFDISCNLACRTCGVESSTFWQRHLKDHGLWPDAITPQSNKEEVINTLSRLDLSNLRQLVFCGGETLLGNEYWAVAQWLADNVPDAKKNLTLCFQTNGTQKIPTKNYPIIEKFHLVKLHISLDGVAEQFEYLRWPAGWTSTVNNLLDLKQNLTSNVMFVIEETISIFNLAYTSRLQDWTNAMFDSNRQGDFINHTRHLAMGIFSLNNCSAEYVEAMRKTPYFNLIPGNWQENTLNIQHMIEQIKQFDSLRGENFKTTFSEVAGYYARFL